MFGYIVINSEKLNEDQEQTYRSFYCGLCFALNETYGKKYSILLNNDMTFLSLVLSGLEEPETIQTRKRCPIHFKKDTLVSHNLYTDYARDMTILLSYYKALDDEKDEKKPSRLLRRLLDPMKDVKEKYPKIVQQVEVALRDISQFEKQNSTDLDALCNASGRMVEAIFSFPGVSFEKEMRGLGFALGKFIYLMDAYDDLEEDIKKKRFNPLKNKKEEEDFSTKIESYLELFLSEATDCFERMPILEYSDIIRNILYSGVWNRYEQIQKKKKEVKR